MLSQTEGVSVKMDDCPLFLFPQVHPICLFAPLRGLFAHSPAQMPACTHFVSDPYRDLIIVTEGSARTMTVAEELEQAVEAGIEVAPIKQQDGVHVHGAEFVVDYERGSFFGELEFLGLSAERSTTVNAKSFCEIATLHPKDIKHVIEEDPQLHKRLHRYAVLKQKLEAISKQEGEIDEVEVERLKQRLERAFEADGADSPAATGDVSVGRSVLEVYFCRCC
eukprot:COSAG05_NODE_1805_length_4045_cov_24.194015_2_plen_222_part_00